MLIEPRTPAEFKALALQAIDLESVPDREGLLAALDEVMDAIVQVYVGEQLALTPCQKFVGHVFLEAVTELLEDQERDIITS